MDELEKSLFNLGLKTKKGNNNNYLNLYFIQYKCMQCLQNFKLELICVHDCLAMDSWSRRKTSEIVTSNMVTSFKKRKAEHMST